RVPKINDIEGVKPLRTVLQPKALGEAERLEDSDVEVLESGSAQGITSQVAERVGSRDREGGGIEIQSAWTVRLLRSGRKGSVHKVGALEVPARPHICIVELNPDVNRPGLFPSSRYHWSPSPRGYASSLLLGSRTESPNCTRC